MMTTQELSAVRVLSADRVTARSHDNTSGHIGAGRLIPNGKKRGETVGAQKGIVVEPKIELGIFFGCVFPSQTHTFAPEQRSVTLQDGNAGMFFLYGLRRPVRAIVIY
jgi:hypothetical protein